MTTHRRARVTEADKVIGAKLRTARVFAGLSMEKLAAKVDLTFQQIQKYEQGSNRLSCSILLKIAVALGVPPASIIDPQAETHELPVRLRKSFELMRTFRDLPEAMQDEVSRYANSLAAAIAAAVAKQPQAAE